MVVSFDEKGYEMKKCIFVVIIFLTGCAVQITPVATGGSKADGIVNLSYEYGLLQKPIVDWESADKTAKQRCKAWGYKNAESFGGSQNSCQARNEYGGCVRTQVSTAYQCTN